MRKLFFTAFAMIFLPTLAFATGMTPLKQMPAGEYELDPTHASLVFKIDHIGLSHYTARFTDFSAELTLDPKDPTQSKLTASINPLSITTHYPNSEKKDFDKELATGEQWFNSGKFPKVTFTMTSLEANGENRGIMKGDMTMLGVTKPVTFDVQYNGAYESKPFANVPALGFSATGRIERSQWGLDTYVPNIGDEVEIIMELEFHKKP